MKIDDIRALAQIMKENSLTSLKIDENGTKIELARDNAAKSVCMSVPEANTVSAGAFTPTESIVSESEDIFTVTAPMVGMFYASSNPKEPPYAALDATVKAGDTLCIIEAMKLMNEIASEVDGTIEEICVVNEQIVEFGQPLFRIRRNA